MSSKGEDLYQIDLDILAAVEDSYRRKAEQLGQSMENIRKLAAATEDICQGEDARQLDLKRS